MKVIELDNVDDYLKFSSDSKKLIVIDVYAEWCVPCKKLGPMYENYVKNFKKNENVVFCKLNYQDLGAEEILNMINYDNNIVDDNMSLPTIFFIKNKKIEHTITGCNMSLFEKTINNYFGSGSKYL